MNQQIDGESGICAVDHFLKSIAESEQDGLQKILATLDDCGAEILRIREKGFEVTEKRDLSPVTEADQASENIILSALRSCWPAISIVSEEETFALESECASLRLPSGYCWLVDPLDGTREFLSGHNDFTVNIALVQDGLPVLGFIYLPCTGEVYLGGGQFGSFAGLCDLKLNSGYSGFRSLQVNTGFSDSPIALVSRSHCDEMTSEVMNWLVSKIPGMRIQQAGSATKFCIIASGEGDFYLRGPGPKVWDVAAGAAIMQGAEGFFMDLQEEPALNSFETSSENHVNLYGIIPAMKIKPAQPLGGGTGLEARPFAALSVTAMNILRQR
ncbi:MAG: hypothetical protein CVV64_06455 [Candidatus Wallbacteria bacterium HGW-Wallbacteria-1]|jgi:3'(2'),5'-bisphosphate nucleotidase|uniref:3'(2'),5'-bisphosphate nucleotidase CysQ n=1 Tax=Candidatus Wallbacteria bacterium HGW-Wallbacteria-1 TaxID=2013854 RepID=A0A2N1PST8_9BACT|nr:MAG: hypothetical protein CVV64_06455 [Candidatus Wallbacteria bacterium HGW-Wallbacteria-1]